MRSFVWCLPVLGLSSIAALLGAAPPAHAIELPELRLMLTWQAPDRAIAPAYLTRFRKTGQFDMKREADFGAGAPDDLAARSTRPGSGFRPGEAVGPAAIGERPAA